MKKIDFGNSWITNIVAFIVLYFLLHVYFTWDVVKGIVPQLEKIEIVSQQEINIYELDKPLLVHFWASWCKVCEFEHESINRIADDYTVLSIAAFSGTDTELLQSMKKLNVKYPVINDNEGNISNEWGVSAFPASFVVNKDNQIQFVEIGYSTEFGIRGRLLAAKYF